MVEREETWPVGALSSGSLGVVPAHVASSDFKCPECSREFKSKRGLSIHRRAAHPVEFHEEQLVELNTRPHKTRWSESEMIHLASIEAKIMFEKGDVGNMNQLLLNEFNDRTLESIKGKRRQVKYKNKVQQLFLNLQKFSESVVSPDLTSRSPDHSLPVQTSLSVPNVSVSLPDDVNDVLTQNLVGSGAGLSEIPPGVVDLDCDPVSSVENVDDDFNFSFVDNLSFSSVNNSLILPLSHVLETDENILLNVDSVERIDVETLDVPPFESWNSMRKYGPLPTHEELSLLDEALRVMDSDSELAKTLSLKFLNTLYIPKKIVEKSGKEQITGVHGNYISNRKRKKIEYAKLQKSYKQNRSRTYQKIFNKNSFDNSLLVVEQFNFWKNLLTHQTISKYQPLARIDDVEVCAEVKKRFVLVTPDEVKAEQIKGKTSPGPDGLSAKALKKIPYRIRAKLYSLWLHLKWMPDEVMKSITIFIPKKERVTRPADSRPISISSVLMREFHKVLSKKVITSANLSMRQYGFRELDGISEAIRLFHKILKGSNLELTPVTAAVLDLHKAFDSLDHTAIYNTLTNNGYPEEFVEYIMFVYKNSYTHLSFRNSVSEPIRPIRGVRQGDPLSPVLFLLVFENVLKKIPSNEGFVCEGERVPFAAFADDLVLYSSSSKGLQRMINMILPILGEVGLRINGEKSNVLCWLKDSKKKRLIYNNKCKITIEAGQLLKNFEVNEPFKYLGVLFDTRGSMKIDTSSLIDKMNILKKTQLKPQQKLFFLRTHLLPSIVHEFTFSKLLLGRLKKLDVAVRNWVRGVLHLPKDVPLALMHGSAADGGLAIPSLRWLIPMLAHKRGLLNSNRMLKNNNSTIDTRSKLNSKWRREIVASCDGSGLAEARKVPAAHYWVVDGTNLLSGSDYISCIHVRLNVLYARSRAARGRPDKTKFCARGCQTPETLDHILQKCWATHHWRIRRHDALNNYLERNLSNNGYSVHREEQVVTTQGTLKPDIIAYSPNTTLIIDSQVINDQYPLDTAHLNKISKYIPVLEKVRDLRSNTKLTSLTLSWRGLLSPLSASELVELGVLKKSEFKVIATRSLFWSKMGWRAHQNMTGPRSMKKGIG